MGKLQEAMLQEMELKGYSPKTIRAYLGHMRRYTIYLGKSPADAGENDVKRYLHHLISDQVCDIILCTRSNRLTEWVPGRVR